MPDSANTDCMTNAFPVLLVALLQLSFIYHRMPKTRSLFHGSLMSHSQLNLKVMGMMRARVLQCHRQVGQSLGCCMLWSWLEALESKAGLASFL